ncbi:MAG: hypothetical protein IJW50_07825 [Clostridia bacterium]|nr:hypothetical protein [Clostridia bacterium]
MRRLTFIMAISILLLSILSCTAPESIDEYEMVFLTGDKLDYVYDLLLDDSSDYKKLLEHYSLTIVKESITPIYTVDLLEYAKNGHFILTLHGSNMYIAKIITAENEFAGNVAFYIKDGVARHGGDTLSNKHPLFIGPGGNYLASCSYADHAWRIQEILNKNEFVSPYDVKYVSIEYVGDFFYVKNNGEDVFIPVGFMKCDETDTEPIEPIDLSLFVDTQLKVFADSQLEEYNKWKQEYHGLFEVGEFRMAQIYSGCSRVDNIMNIHEYLNID